jgi:hypothetical protein
MTDMPERIWVTTAAMYPEMDGGMWWPEKCDGVEYVRHDLPATERRVAELEAALRLLQSRAADLLHCYRHGNGLIGWQHNADRLGEAITNATAVLSE